METKTYLNLYYPHDGTIYDAIKFTGYNKVSIQNFIKERSSQWFIEIFTRNKLMLKKDNYTCRPFSPEPGHYLIFIKNDEIESTRFRISYPELIKNSNKQTVYSNQIIEAKN